MRRLIVFGANQMGAQMINYLSRNIDNVVVGIRFGVTELGFYSRAYNLVRLPMNQISTPVSGVAMPVLSRLQDDPVRFRAYVLRGQTVLVHTMACLFGFLAAQADPIVEFVLGAKWSPIVPFLIILAIGGVFQTASSASQWVINARGHGGAFLRLMLFTRSLMIVLIIVSSAWGTIGVACAYSVSCVVILVVSTVWSGRVADAPVGGPADQCADRDDRLHHLFAGLLSRRVAGSVRRFPAADRGRGAGDGDRARAGVPVLARVPPRPAVGRCRHRADAARPPIRPAEGQAHLYSKDG